MKKIILLLIIFTSSFIVIMRGKTLLGSEIMFSTKMHKVEITIEGKKTVCYLTNHQYYAEFLLIPCWLVNIKCDKPDLSEMEGYIDGIKVNKSFSSDLDFDIISKVVAENMAKKSEKEIKELEQISDDFATKQSVRRTVNFLITFLRTKTQNEIDNKLPELTTEQKLLQRISVLGGKINLLEMRIIQLEGKRK